MGSTGSLLRSNSPVDGGVIDVTPESIENGSMINFVWQAPNDPDNDVVHFNRFKAKRRS